MDDLKRRIEEGQNEYIARIYKYKIEYGLTNKDCCEVINKELNSKYAESTLRSIAYPFTEGYELGFERALSEKELNNELEELEQKKIEIQKERMKLQSTKIEYNRNLRKDSRFELFYENLDLARERLPLPEFEELNIDIDSNGEYVLSLADIHYGAFFESANNSYSREEAKRRLEFLLLKLRVLINKNDIHTLNIIELGDTIQGILRISDIKLNDIPVVDSVIEVSRLLATFLNKLSKYCNIRYKHVMASNHSQNRYLGTKANEMPHEDMEKVIANYIMDLVSDNPRIEVELQDKDYLDFELCGQNILSLHGHQIKNIKSAIKDYSMLHRKFYDIAFVAHFHGGQSLSVGESNGNTEIKICPSFIGSDPYSDSLKIGSKGMCKLYKIEENQGITEEYTIVLN